MKWTRQRCHAAPISTEAIADFSPVWASLITSWTPPSPRAFRPRRNAVQNAPSSLSPTSKPEHLAAAVGGDPGGDHHRLGHHPPVDPGLAVGGVEEHVGVGDLGQGPVPERPDLLIEVRADPRDLGLADPGVGAQGLDQVVDLPGRDPVQVGLHHHREQRLVDPPPTLEQARGRTTRPAAWGSAAPDHPRSWSASAAGTRCAASVRSSVRSQGPAPITRSARRRSTPGRSSALRCGPGPQPQQPAWLPTPRVVQHCPRPSCVRVLSVSSIARSH